MENTILYIYIDVYMHAYYKDFYLRQQIYVYIMNHYFEL